MRPFRRALLAPLLLTFACSKGGGGDEGDAGTEPVPVVTAQTAVAQVQDFAATVTALGTVAAAPGHVAALAAPAATRVLRVYVSAGQAVAAGQPLVALDQTAFSADTRKAEVAHSTAQREYDRASRLAAAGILPRKDAETAASALAEANAALIQARHIQAQAVLRSPIPGVVSQVNATLNAPADPAQTLVQVVDPRGMEIHLSLPPEQAARVHAGLHARFSSGRQGAPVALGEGTVTGVGAVIDTATGTVDARAALTHPSGSLFAGQDLTAEIDLAQHSHAVTVPAEAVVPAESGYQVFVVDGRGIAHARPVSVGARHQTVVEIASGLQGGETVVTTGAYGVQDGAHIRRGAP